MQKEEKRRRKMEQNFDQHHKAKSSRPLQKGEEGWLPDVSASGTVQAEVAPRSHIVHTDNGDLRQNRKHLVPMDLTRTKVQSTEIELPQAQPELPEILPEGETEAEVLRENVVIPEKFPQSETAAPEPLPEGTYRTKGGRLSKPPDRLPSSWPELKGNLKKWRCSDVN